jgi:hypothetical protein
LKSYSPEILIQHHAKPLAVLHEINYTIPLK